VALSGVAWRSEGFGSGSEVKRSEAKLGVLLLCFVSFRDGLELTLGSTVV